MNAVTARWRKRFILILATGGGLGYSPVASGTVGSLPGVVLTLVLFPGRSWPLQLLIATALFIAAIPICGAAERHFATKDDGRIVADEYLTFPLCLVGLPLAGEAAWLLPTAFVTCRLFDILKPWPANRMQQLPGGRGIVLDDLFAALYSLATNHAILAAVILARR